MLNFLKFDRGPCQDHYDDHRVDLKDLSALSAARIFCRTISTRCRPYRRENFETVGSFTEQEITSEGGSFLKKNRFGLLQPFKSGDLLIREDLRRKSAKCPAVSPPPQRSYRSLPRTPAPYQRGESNGLSSSKRGFVELLADEMGLRLIASPGIFFPSFDRAPPALSSVPHLLLFNWQREFEKFFAYPICLFHQGKERLRTVEDLSGKQVILTSYALLRIDAALLQKLSIKWLFSMKDRRLKIPIAKSPIVAFACKVKSGCDHWHSIGKTESRISGRSFTTKLIC